MHFTGGFIMSNYKPVKIKRKNRTDSVMIRSIVYRVLPIILVVVISICGFTIFNKKISEILATVKHSSLADRGNIDDHMLDNYNKIDIEK